MKTKIPIIVALLTIVAGPDFKALQAATLQNADFEAPDISPWEAEGAGAVVSLNTNLAYVHGGLQSAEIDFPGQDNTGIHQNISVSEADLFQTYNVSFWVLAPGLSATVGARACLWEFGPTGITFNNGDYVWISAQSSNWVHVAATLTTTRGDANVFRAVLQIAPQGSPKISGTLWVDDADVELPVAPPSTDITWVGGVAGNAWDFVTANWVDTANSTPMTYANGAVARFTDTGNDRTPVSLNGTFSPSTVSVESAIDYSFAGSGRLSGGAQLRKTGAGTLTLSNSGNDYTNNTLITSGTLRLGANEVIPDGAGKGACALGGTLDLNGFSETVNNLSGTGTLDNSATTPAQFVLNSMKDTEFDGFIQNSGGGDLTWIKSGPGMLTKWGGTSSFSGRTVINGGRILLHDASFAGAGSLIISNGAYLMLWGSFGSGEIANDTFLYSVSTLQGGEYKGSIFMDSGSGAMALSGVMRLMSTSDLNAYKSETLSISGKVTGPGGLWKGSPSVLTMPADYYAGTVVLANSANDFTGGVSVFGGTLEIQAGGAAGTGNAWVTNGANLQLDANTALNSNASLLLCGTNPQVTLNYTGIQAIRSLSFDGGATFQAAGTWGGAGSGAAYTDSRLIGTGLLNVTSAPLTPPTILAPAYDVTGANLLLRISTVQGHAYVLESTSDLTSPGSWSTVSTNSGTGGTLTNLAPVSRSIPRVFYRYSVR